MVSRFSIDVRWSGEDDGFIAVCPELEGLSAFGESAGAAVAELEEAISLAVETYAEEGWPLPKPRGYPQHSGQLRLRLPRSLHSWLVAEAEQEGVSLNTFLVGRLSEVRGRRETVALGQQIMNTWVARRVESLAYRWEGTGGVVRSFPAHGGLSDQASVLGNVVLVDEEDTVRLTGTAGTTFNVGGV